MFVQLRLNPFIDPIISQELTDKLSIEEILESIRAPSWFYDYGIVRLYGEEIERKYWKSVFIKPEARGILELDVVQSGNKLLPILGAVAITALTAGIGAGGIAAVFGLGAASTFAAGGVGATLAAAAFGIAGQIALNALTGPNVKSNDKAQRELSQAGISQNSVVLLAPLPVNFGHNLYSPPQLIEPYTTLDGGEITLHAVVGLEGWNLVENPLINGVDITQLDGLNYEIREGGPGDSPLTLCQEICIQQTDQRELVNIRTKLEVTFNDQLEDQDNPDNSLPDYQHFITDGEVTHEADEIRIRFTFPNGIFQASTLITAFVPVRIEIRRVGDVAYRNLPTVHFQDLKPGTGPFQAEINLKFQTQPSGRHFSNSDDNYPVVEITNITGIGQSFEYQADAYFQNSAYPFTDQIPTMTGATTSGVTMSAESELGAGSEAWRAGDKGAAKWQPANNTLPTWLQVQYSSAKTIRSYLILFDSINDTVPTTAALTFYTEGSNDGVNWTLLDETTVDISSFPMPYGYYQTGSPGSYIYYRHHFLSNNGAANQQIAIKEISHYLFDAPGLAAGHDTTALNGHVAAHTSTGDPRSIYGSAHKNGATFYLDPAQWPKGQYEVRVKRGWTNTVSNMTWPNYSNGLGAAFTFHFSYQLSGGVSTIPLGQAQFRSDTIIEVFSTVYNESPVDTSGLTCIAVEIKNTKVNSISFEITPYVSVYGDNVWSEVKVPSRNPAALYRAFQLGYGNLVPTAGELLNEAELIAWFNRCVDNDYECNFVASQETMAEVKNTLAYCGYAAVRDSNLCGVAEDFDRTGTFPMQALTSRNSQNLGTELSLPKIPHALNIEYLDDENKFKPARLIVYRRGFTELTAIYFDTINYKGFTDTDKVLRRGAFDLLQLELRNKKYRRRIGPEGFSMERNSFIALNDDTLDIKHASARIKKINSAAGNIVSITVDNLIRFSEGPNDLDALLEGIDPANPFGVQIRLNDGSFLIKTLSNLHDSKTAVFTAPFPLAGSGIEEKQLVMFGIAGREKKNCIILAVDPEGIETRVLTLVDEAPELFALTT